MKFEALEENVKSVFLTDDLFLFSPSLLTN